ncbi:hypothetical protein [Lysobacter sp. N42]|uniref:hypothetical protein n=1 Tax=Lysobacter sp. N42 TaxID=2545719 RepID=UPI00104A57F5|nr:hypothetical protein [Lysobacter sp. N42]TCZ89096.1 hypothetical protein EYQ95_13105 [Lysobacter sp. N42]
MITLNTDKGLVRIDQWDDIESRPGFAPVVDPKAIKLREIIGRYSFPFDIPCGLSNCRTPHKHGFLVVAIDGRETNLGRVCGKREFGTDFQALSKVFVAAERAQRNREFLTELKSRLPSIATEVSALRTAPDGAGWIYPRISQLTGMSSSLPTPIVNAVRKAMRRGDGVLLTERAATEAERATASPDVKGLEHMRRNVSFIEERVGQLDGFAALAPGNGLRDALGAIEPFLSTLADADIDSLSDKQLRELSKVAGELEPNLERLRTVIAAGRRLLVRQNIAQLLRFATNRAEEKQFDLFLRDLPEQEA